MSHCHYRKIMKLLFLVNYMNKVYLEFHKLIFI